MAEPADPWITDPRGSVMESWGLVDKKAITITAATGRDQTLRGQCVVNNEVKEINLKVTKVNLQRNRIAGGGDLYLYAVIMEGSYASILGFFVKSGIARCRHFYRSQSESAWRAGTGGRADGGWVKSGEGHASHDNCAYIMEALLPRELEMALDDFKYAKLPGRVRQNKPHYVARADHRWINWIIDNIGTLPDTYQHFIKPENTTSGIIDDYVQERVYVYPMADTKLLRNEQKTGYLGSVTLQKDFMLTDSSKNKYKDDKSYEIKKAILDENYQNAHFPELLKILDQPLLEPYYNPDRIDHTALNEPYQYNTYRFTPSGSGFTVNIEIAYTIAARPLHYIGDDNREASANTRICWVRNCYIEGDLTSFGNFKRIPIDMAFLVQKPCDYVAQISDDLARRVGLKRELVRGRNPYWIARVDDDNNRQNIFNQNIMGSYVSLAVFNESTSPLIKLFKIRRNFPLFTNKFKAGFIAFKPEMEPAQLKRLVLAGITDYISFHEDNTQTKRDKLALFNKSGSHGSVGLRRARELLELIQNADEQLVVSHFYGFFSLGRVGTRTMSTGRFGHAIQANPYSLFTQIAVRIIGYYCYDSAPDQQQQEKMTRFGQVPADSKVRFSSPGNDKCVQRMLNKALSAGIPRNEEYAHWVRNNAPMLLEAFKR